MVTFAFLCVDPVALFWEASIFAGWTVQWPANMPGRVNFPSAGCQQDLGTWIQIVHNMLSSVWFQALVLVLPAVRVFVEESRALWCCLTVFFWLPTVLKKVKWNKSVLILLSRWLPDLLDLKIRSRDTEKHCKLIHCSSHLWKCHSLLMTWKDLSSSLLFLVLRLF